MRRLLLLLLLLVAGLVAGCCDCREPSAPAGKGVKKTVAPADKGASGRVEAPPEEPTAMEVIAPVADGTADEAETCGCDEAAGEEPGDGEPSAAKPTVAGAEKFVADLEAELLKLWVNMERANWVKATYITHDTEIIAAAADAAVMEFIGRKVEESKPFNGLELPPVTARKLLLLKVAMPLAAPSDDRKRALLTRTATEMDSIYGKGKFCPEGKCMDLGEMSEILAKSRDYDELLLMWQGWRGVSPLMREGYRKFVELGNEGARELGFANLGDMWKSAYDMSPAEFQAETDRLYEQVKPLYQDLHCHVRAKLQEVYGVERVPSGKPIPAHLLGNMWGQEWNNLYDILAPEAEGKLDLDAILKEKGYDPIKMTRQAEGFFVSLGLDPLPRTFWERSLFDKPQDREVVCHASAWDIDYKDDLRIKMCIQITGEEFATIHQELGHSYYQRAYKEQPTLFMNSANDGFHEALGDTISLSVTPSYMVQIGLLESLPPDNLNPLMKRALEKVAFLPFGLLIDRWRWDVFAGVTKPDDYNKAWWELRRKYQGVAAPVERSENDFDPGAKYHIPANVPYTRYFLATILQFQFHRALCKVAGHKGPLHTCSIYGNKEAGRRLNEMMKMGLANSWPEALKALTGETQMDATAMLDYFKPLHDWLKEQNKGRTCGW